MGKGDAVKINTVQFDTPVDALVALAKRLANYESMHKLTSEDFFDHFMKGQMDDSEEFTEWANAYRHYLSIRKEILSRLQHAA